MIRSFTLHFIQHRLRSLFRMLRADDGAATLEFVIIFPLMFSIFLASVDAGVTMIRQSMLYRAVDIAIRQVRIGNIPDDGSVTLAELICANSRLLPNCTQNIAVEMQRIDGTNTASLSAPFQCIRAEEPIQPALEFTNGASHDLMIVRVCVTSNPFIRMTGYMTSLPINAEGDYQLTARAVFVNEPRNS